MKFQETGLSIRREKDMAAVEAERLVFKWANKVGKPSYMIAQSFEMVNLTVWDGALPPFAKTFAGRVFGSSGEVRWVREIDRYHVWWTAEELPGDVSVMKTERRYYLWGYFDNGRWAEARISRDLSYPVPARSDRAREFIIVAEYRQQLTTLPTTPDGWEEVLNKPRIFAHRFMSLDAGANTPDGGEI